MGINVLAPATTALYQRRLIDEPALWQRDWEPDDSPYAPTPDGRITIGHTAESFDKLRFFHKKTMNRDTRYNGASGSEPKPSSRSGQAGQAHRNSPNDDAS